MREAQEPIRQLAGCELRGDNQEAVADDHPNGHPSDDIEEQRAILARRVSECFDRLDDVVSELSSLHSVDAEQIHARVRATIQWEAAMDCSWEYEANDPRIVPPAETPLSPRFPPVE
jgi:hypothetical protein